jgi:hypothetical protein
MKRIFFPLGLLLALVSPTVADDQSRIVRVTTYWREEGQSRAAYNGSKLREGHCAVDPKKIPYGSKVILPGDELIAVDTGPAVVSRKAARLCGRTSAERDAVVVDRYFETKAMALAWEKSHPHFMTARIVPPESRRKKNGAVQDSQKELAARQTSKRRTSEAAPPAVLFPSQVIGLPETIDLVGPAYHRRRFGLFV